MPTFALAIKKHTQLQIKIGSVAQLNRASDYGSEGCRFESCRSHQVLLNYPLKRMLCYLTFSFFVYKYPLLQTTNKQVFGSVEKYWGCFFCFIVFCIFAL